jgi:hypothetical protein
MFLPQKLFKKIDQLLCFVMKVIPLEAYSYFFSLHNKYHHKCSGIFRHWYDFNVRKKKGNLVKRARTHTHTTVARHDDFVLGTSS